MKLTTKNNLNFLSISLLIFVLWIVFFYILLRKQVEQNINFELEKRKSDLLMQIKTGRFDTISEINYLDIKVRIKATKLKLSISPKKIKDTVLYDRTKNQLIPYRKLNFTTQIKEKNYNVSIFKSLEESDMLIVRILLLNTLIIILLIIILFILNYISSKSVWKSFYKILKQVNEYDMQSKDSLRIEKSEIVEFQDLNLVLNKMTNKIRTDYFKLKEFTENISHEIQNPLAIINAKMELLLQSEHLNEGQYKAIGDTYEASTRLSVLNKTLLLLTKIDNDQFPEAENINLKDKINHIIEQYKDNIENKSIKVDINIDHNQNLFINSFLSDILFSNLIKNAIRHNIENGKIRINTTLDSFCISNTGQTSELNTKKIFNRFYKSSNSQNSLGLGLALIKKICDVNGYTIKYSKEKQWHQFKINLVR